MYLPDKQRVTQSSTDVHPAGLSFLSRVGNKGVSPKEMWGDSFDAEGYMTLFAAGQPRLFSDYALVRHYRAPQSASPASRLSRRSFAGTSGCISC